MEPILFCETLKLYQQAKLLEQAASFIKDMYHDAPDNIILQAIRFAGLDNFKENNQYFRRKVNQYIAMWRIMPVK